MKVIQSRVESFALKLTIRDTNEKEIARASLYLIKNDLHDEPYGLMEDVFVDLNHRGQGLGKRIVKEIIDKAKELGCYKLIANCKSDIAYSLYINLGFHGHGHELRMNLI